MLKKIWLMVATTALTVALALAMYVYGAPVVVLHYSAAASGPVGFFFNDDDSITKDTLEPGTSRQFRTAHYPHAGYFVEVSLPLASRAGVEIRPPFSRVDVHIGADTNIMRTVIKTDFMARIGSD
ncbi:hypothetical protein [Janthinobacterium psychrotolerans]|uniref:Uncharacterized protein n=1 Tax=Janthinobacterium psychrotolerans TaxID=1747903 RepID=A0A1A7C985_9BURK|nr:hypothetical protein [Janthinobacterium psychrotolerans]OBV41569.1 hypothetical protein ASR47_103512 [Janthinobacterium psychrotolerans]